MQQPCSQCGAASAPEATLCASCGAALTPPRKKLSLRLVLPVLAFLVILALAAGGFLLSANRAHQPAGPPPLYANSLTQNAPAWQCEPGASCQFETDGLHILAPTDHLYFSTLSGRQFGEQVIDVQASLDNGDPQIVGVVIAFRSIGVDGYGFLVFANGTYELVKWDPLGNVTYLVPLMRSSAVHTGLDRTNELKVIAKGDQITLFVNGKQLQRITDATYSSGSVLLGAARFAADAVFSNLTITRP